MVFGGAVDLIVKDYVFTGVRAVIDRGFALGNRHQREPALTCGFRSIAAGEPDHDCAALGGDSTLWGGANGVEGFQQFSAVVADDDRSVVSELRECAVVCDDGVRDGVAGVAVQRDREVRGFLPGRVGETEVVVGSDSDGFAQSVVPEGFVGCPIMLPRRYFDAAVVEQRDAIDTVADCCLVRIPRHIGQCLISVHRSDDCVHSCSRVTISQTVEKWSSDVGVWEDAQQDSENQAAIRARMDKERAERVNAEAKQTSLLASKQSNDIAEFVRSVRKLGIPTESYKLYAWVSKSGPDFECKNTRRSVTGWAVQSYWGLSRRSDVDTSASGRTYHVVVTVDGEIYETERQSYKTGIFSSSWVINPVPIPTTRLDISKILVSALSRMMGDLKR